MRRLVFAAFGLVVSLQAAIAADAVFPPASRIGIVPPQEMQPSKRFSGFENPDRAAGISFVEMPPEAYPQLVAGLTNDALKRQGMNVTGRESVKLDGRSGILITGNLLGGAGGRKWLLALKDQGMTALLVAQIQGDGEGYTDAQMLKALKSVSLRGPVSIEEQLSALPFRIGDRGGFRPVRVLSGNSVLFTEGPKDNIAAIEQPIVILATSLSAPPPVGERREQFARAALSSNQILKNVTIERADTFRLKGQEWHEIVAKANEAVSGEAIVVMQTIRFDPDRYVRMVAMTRADSRDRDLPRFRHIIDSVEVNE
ncbi:hypothetical protein [Microvirga flavescens]|uniref:hypothetical protein n=1 Tax=Microvirga flavescens TaxID=2249811 RepID=UPI000DDAC48E|nr:hypothetical protein [Microvirga flavescens]